MESDRSEMRDFSPWERVCGPPADRAGKLSSEVSFSSAHLSRRGINQACSPAVPMMMMMQGCDSAKVSSNVTSYTLNLDAPCVDLMRAPLAFSRDFLRLSSTFTAACAHRGEAKAEACFVVSKPLCDQKDETSPWRLFRTARIERAAVGTTLSASELVHTHTHAHRTPHRTAQKAEKKTGLYSGPVPLRDRWWCLDQTGHK